jgi:hypothetical protein
VNVLVCGGRDFADRDFVFRCLDRAHAKRPITLVISGGADGADALGEQWAQANRVHCAVVKALWNARDGSLDRSAGPKRNEAMLSLAPDAVIAFPGGNGTAHMVRVAMDANVTVWEPKP